MIFVQYCSLNAYPGESHFEVQKYIVLSNDWKWTLNYTAALSVKLYVALVKLVDKIVL